MVTWKQIWIRAPLTLALFAGNSIAASLSGSGAQAVASKKDEALVIQGAPSPAGNAVRHVAGGVSDAGETVSNLGPGPGSPIVLAGGPPVSSTGTPVSSTQPALTPVLQPSVTPVNAGTTSVVSPLTATPGVSLSTGSRAASGSPSSSATVAGAAAPGPAGTGIGGNGLLGTVNSLLRK